MTGAIGAAVPEIEPDTHVDTFGQAHNIAANEAAKRLYVIGSRYGIGSGVCAGGKICATYLTGIKSSSTVTFSVRLTTVTVELHVASGPAP